MSYVGPGARSFAWRFEVPVLPVKWNNDGSGRSSDSEGIGMRYGSEDLLLGGRRPENNADVVGVGLVCFGRLMGKRRGMARCFVAGKTAVESVANPGNERKHGGHKGERTKQNELASPGKLSYHTAVRRARASD